MTAIAYPIILGVFGAAVGSFLNVVIYRLPRDGLSVRKPARSFCPNCKRQIRWYENLPIFSWLLLGARCPGCKQPIPVRYVLVEVLTAFLFAAYTHLWYQRMGSGGEDYVVLVTHLALIAVCVAVTYIDIDFKIIPNEITWPGMALGVILSLVVPLLHRQSWLFVRATSDWEMERHLAGLLASGAGLVTGVGVVWLVGFLGAMAFRKEAMGLGDVKYLGLVGALLGFDGVLLVFFLGCFTGAVGGIIHRMLTGDRYIAFGPYLSLGVVLTLFFRAEILHFFLVTWPEAMRSGMGLAG